MATHHTDTRYVSLKIQQYQAARTALQVLDLHIAALFTLEACRAWKADGISGLRAACFAQAQELNDVPGAWDAREALLLAAREGSL